MDNTLYSQSKLMEYAFAFRKLVKMYDVESNNPLALQLNETAAMLERVSGKEYIGNVKYAEMKRMLIKYLGSRRICIEHLLIMENTPGRLSIIMNISYAGKGCITVRELAREISFFFKREFWAAKGGRQIITGESGEYIFEEALQYRLVFGRAGCNKGFSYISGDSFSYIETEGGKSVVTLVDGVGTGAEAKHLSTKVIELLEQLLEAGFAENAAVNMVNSIFASNDWVGNPATIDLCSVNAYEGSARFIKMGASASFIKSKEGTRIIPSTSLPAGVIENAGYDEAVYGLSDGDYIIMVSDGVLDALPFYDKEKKFKELIEELDERIPTKMAERLLNEIFFYDDKIEDDMTILVTGIWKR